MNREQFVFAILAGLVAGFPSSSMPAEQPRELEKEVRRVATAAIDAGRAVGISIGIAKGDDILLAEGYGFADLEAKVPATADTVYRIGSITKQFTAVAILQLAARGDIELDTPITTYVSNYPTHDPPVTVRHLLQHTSGIQSFTDLPSYQRLMHKDVTHDEILARFKDLPQHFEPGERFRYCNSGYYLLGVALENVAGTTYEQYLKTNAFQRLRLEHTYYDRPGLPNRAWGYRRTEEGFEKSRYLSMTQPFSAGALASTVNDLLRWQHGLIGEKLLNEKSYKAMTTRGMLPDGKEIVYGLGLFIRQSAGRPTIGHGGGINGFRSDLMYYPDSDHTIVVLANSERPNPGRISRQIAQHLFSDRCQTKGMPNASANRTDYKGTEPPLMLPGSR